MSGWARVRVKICGITTIDDARLAVAVGADAIGLVFAPKSPRCIELEQASRICSAISPFVTKVALLMDPDPADLDRIAARLPIDLLQFHGSESDAFCVRSGIPYIKALSVDQTCEPDWDQLYPGARGFIIDSHAKGAAGGTGKTFDWDRFPVTENSTLRPLILAGGLNVDNVANAIKACRPYAVDVSSGVESSPGIKDRGLMSRFMTEVSGASDS